MVDDALADAGGAAYRGFLFSDVRGFTAFAERYGNTAAADMVSRFLDVARAAIARHKGAEIKTEGDNIHAVFPSASGAVLCGLEIVDAAAELNAKQPDRPLNLGVGVHAGEAVETAEGYIGRAVNIAARLCAVAKPGEVLVSSTVKGITQASITVGFVPRGRRKLKGIRDPILVYAVTRDPNVKVPREVPRPVVVTGAALVLVGVIAVAAFAGSRLFPSASASPSAGATPSAPGPRVLAIGKLDVGSYVSAQFQPAVTFDISDPGWSASRDLPEILGLLREDSPQGSVEFLQVQEVITNPCNAAAEGSETRPAVVDVISELKTLALGHISLSASKVVKVGGHTGEQVDVTVSNGALAACGGLAGGEVGLFGVGGDTWRASAGELFRLISVPIGDRSVTIALSTDWAQTQSVQELEQLFDSGQAIIDSVRF